MDILSLYFLSMYVQGRFQWSHGLRSGQNLVCATLHFVVVAMCVLESGSTYLVGMYKSLGKKKCSPAAFFYSEDGGSSFFFPKCQ